MIFLNQTESTPKHDIKKNRPVNNNKLLKSKLKTERLSNNLITHTVEPH